MTGTMGRPTKLDQVLRTTEGGQQITVGDQVLNAIRAGNYMEAAAVSAGIDKTTLYDWLKQGARLSTDVEQGRIKTPRAGSRDRQLIEFSHAVAQAEAEWEVSANATLERLGRDRVITETRVTTEAGQDGQPATTKTVTVTKVAEADSATIRWRLERRYPDRYNRSRIEVTGADGGAIPVDLRSAVHDRLEQMANQLAENEAASPVAAAPEQAPAPGSDQVNPPSTDPE